MAAKLGLTVKGDIPADIELIPVEKAFEILTRQAELEVPEGQINLKLVDDKTITALNKEYAGKNKPTDVLSFSYIEDGGQPIEGVIGEMLISIETADRQAQAYGVTLEEELALLSVHGVLHILGHDHVDRSGRQFFDQRQAEILTQAGLKYRDFKWD